MQNLRNTKLYKTITPYLATAYAEGFCEGERASKKDQLIAWQYLHDNHLARTLQGWFGRTIENLINQKSIQK